MSTTDAAGGPLETFSAATRSRFADEAASWVAAIPATIADLASRWSLDLATASATEDRYTIEVQRGEEPLELELTYPDGWWEETSRALEAWRGDGTQRLFEQDPRGARLLERHSVAPAELDEVAALRDVCAVARRLWISAPDGVTTVAVEVRAWASEIQERHGRAGRPYERELVRSAADLLSTLGPTQGDRVLLHGDLHLASLALADDRRVLLGPRPLVGEREFDAASLLRDTPADLIVDVDRGRDRVKTRFGVLIDELSCNPTRLRGWAFATAVDQAVWCAENGNHATGAALVETARMIRALEV
jgi:streptomycin 6-kinase